MKKNANILIVDDDPGIGDMLKLLLEMEGHQVVVSQKPMEMEANIKKHEMDLVLLDMLISGVNGTDVCTEIKNKKTTSHVKILMMSALRDAKEKSLAAGADGFIAKPFETEDLIAKIGEVLDHQE